jgi:CPA2 family monovalent cation:H+ antiporter-2
MVLTAASIAAAKWLFVAIPNGFEAGQIIVHGKTVNPRLHAIARAHSDEEVAHLRRQGADTIIMGERELALAMINALFSQASEIPSRSREGEYPAHRNNDPA